jgi:hypothetical protein
MKMDCQVQKVEFLRVQFRPAAVGFSLLRRLAGSQPTVSRTFHDLTTINPFCR